MLGFFSFVVFYFCSHLHISFKIPVTGEVLSAFAWLTVVFISQPVSSLLFGKSCPEVLLTQNDRGGKLGNKGCSLCPGAIYPLGEGVSEQQLFPQHQPQLVLRLCQAEPSCSGWATFKQVQTWPLAIVISFNLVKTY